jgi:Phage integrase family
LVVLFFAKASLSPLGWVSALSSSAH